MLVDDIGDVTISNDGATILKLLEIEHPAAKVCLGAEGDRQLAAQRISCMAPPLATPTPSHLHPMQTDPGGASGATGRGGGRRHDLRSHSGR